ncbi:hypothetical protein AB1Y20_000898 [Prymnesium parvum]|uniref:Tetratricopeptide repeat protein 29 n=1 Tax=Prymnesium parvum TaxID=97485 RepID=A0AB34K6P3_PRYPA
MPPSTVNATSDGHTFSPALRDQQREVNALYEQVPELAERGREEFRKLFEAGHAQWDSGSTQTALESFGAAYVMARELNYRLGEGMAVERAALCYRVLGEHTRALTMLQGAVRLFEAQADTAAMASALINLAQTHAELGQLPEAARAFEQSRRAASRLYDVPLEIAALVKGAMVELRRESASDAVRLLGQALGLTVASGNTTEEVRVLQRLAAAHGVLAEAWHKASRAYESVREAPAPAEGADETDGVPRESPCASTEDSGSAEEERGMPVAGEDAWAKYEEATLGAVRILERAAKLTEQLEHGEELRLQVFRQLRAHYKRLEDDSAVTRCERDIDQLSELLSSQQG